MTGAAARPGMKGAMVETPGPVRVLVLYDSQGATRELALALFNLNAFLYVE